MDKFKIKGEYIQLNRFLKAMGWCESGGHANSLIDDGKVKVNGMVEMRRRNKVFKGFVVEFGSKPVTIE